MITWKYFVYFAVFSISTWLTGTLILWLVNNKLKLLGHILVFLGILSLIGFATGLWISLERPVFRTLAETRLWYAIFIAIIGLIIYYRWRLLWMLAYSLGMATLFTVLNATHPDTFDKSLMPALQSVWFIPHVIVYIVSYALLGASSIIGIIGLWFLYRKKDTVSIIKIADDIVYIGFAFLTFGLLFGALWAKEAWGHYWTWDPKETWAFLTWLMYLVYIHIRLRSKENIKWAFRALALAFVVLLICWFGVNYLPSAKNSVHTYSRQME